MLRATLVGQRASKFSRTFLVVLCLPLLRVSPILLGTFGVVVVHLFFDSPLASAPSLLLSFSPSLLLSFFLLSPSLPLLEGSPTKDDAIEAVAALTAASTEVRRT